MDKARQRFNRFWVARESGCHEWTGYKTSLGYGMFWLGKVVSAHRAAWMLHKGEPPTKHVCHSCDNPSCVNPDHLFLGTHQDNMRDMRAKSRGPAPLPGSKNPQAKLHESQIPFIRYWLLIGHSQAKVADAFGVSERLINMIAHRKAWAHV